MRSSLLWEISFTLCWISVSNAQRPELLTDNIEAYNIVEGRYNGACVPDVDVQAIGRELRTIREAIPALANVHEPGHYMPQELLISPTVLLSPSLNDTEKKARIHQMILNPLATGFKALDALNTEYGVAKLEGDEDHLMLTLSQPLDMDCVAEAYRKVLGDRVQPNYLYGDGDHIYRAEKKGEPLHYIFRIGRGDCPSGCTEETVYYLNLHPESTGYRIEKVEGPPKYHSLWGYPRRFPVRIFESYDDLLKKTGTSDWSIRLHAVSALGRVYAVEGSGLGEDTFADRFRLHKMWHDVEKFRPLYLMWFRFGTKAKRL